MSVESARLIRARSEAERSRARLLETAHILQNRLAPSTLANDAIDDLKERGQSVVDAAQRRPALAAGIALAVTGFLARRPLAALFRRRRRKTVDGTIMEASNE